MEGQGNRLLSLVEVKFNGLAPEGLMDDLVSLEVDDNLELADMFQTRLRDPGLGWTTDKMMRLGTRVEITVPVPGNPRTLMIGEITAIETSIAKSPASRLYLRAYDRRHRLGGGPRPR